MKHRGIFITFEGADGCGKSTQLQRTRDWLTSLGLDVIVTREPGGCPISERIREILLDVGSTGMSPECEALLFAAARAEHVRRTVRPALENGIIVLCDRFVDSSIAYQAYGRGLGCDYIRAINERAVDGCMPDLTLLFTTDTAVSDRRLHSGRAAIDRLEQESSSFVDTLGRGFLALAAADPRRIQCINANRTIEEIFKDVQTLLTPILEDRPAD